MRKGSYVPNSIDRARDELFSHIRRCGVLDAEDDQRHEWFDDTIQYLGERYPELTPSELSDLRLIGERYCAPAIPHGSGAEEASDTESAADTEESEDAAAALETTDTDDGVEASDAEGPAEPAAVAETAVATEQVEVTKPAEVVAEPAEVVDTGEVSAA